jgi:thioredoxin-dependent peroxiredoxin
MKRFPLALLAACAFALPAHAALSIGAPAPDFTAEASLGGGDFTFILSDALKAGPVVLYFYPAAFTKGCTVEAHEFAEAADTFRKLGATVIGVSHDKIETLNRFSTTECRSKFPVAADTDQHIMKEYDAVLDKHPEYANRTSYVIAPDKKGAGHVIYSYTDLDPTKHVDNTLAAVEKWNAEHGRPATP